MSGACHPRLKEVNPLCNFRWPETLQPFHSLKIICLSSVFEQRCKPTIRRVNAQQRLSHLHGRRASFFLSQRSLLVPDIPSNFRRPLPGLCLRLHRESPSQASYFL
jgi:hypothetical protein